MTAFTLSITGTAPLLMHSARLVDPLDPLTKEKTRAVAAYKKSKTDADYEVVNRLEYFGSLYIDEDLGPYMPSANIERCLVEAGSVTRMGTKVKAAVIIDEILGAPLLYRGPRTAEELWDDRNFVNASAVKVQQARLMRYRPQFRTWAVEFTGHLDEAVLEYDDFVEIARKAGLKGLGDWRPRFGRFEAVVGKA